MFFDFNFSYESLHVINLLDEPKNIIKRKQELTESEIKSYYKYLGGIENFNSKSSFQIEKFTQGELAIEALKSIIISLGDKIPSLISFNEKIGQRYNLNMIIIYIEDPGAKTMLVPFLRYLLRKKQNFQLFCSSNVIKLTNEFELKEINKYNNTSNYAKSILSNRKINYLIVGTSENKKSFSLKLISEAKRNKILSIGAVIHLLTLSIDLKV